MTRTPINGRTLAEAWTLEGKDGEGRPLRLLFSEQELAHSDLGIVVGRHPDLCDRVIDDPSISRRHFRVSVKEGGLRLEDLNALNGTLLDGRPLPPFQAQSLRPGQVLVLGRVFLEIRETQLDGQVPR
ncbi:MAG TPA: FHA domain-containing protein [Kiloniellaceae bacterium]|nr:FHA domain-containing protein [Kiloniellaceae bacterium]